MNVKWISNSSGSTLSNITRCNSLQITNRPDYINTWNIDTWISLSLSFSFFSLPSHHELWDSNEMLDVFQDATSLEQRRAMFDSVDTCQYNAINFEEYLQVIKIPWRTCISLWIFVESFNIKNSLSHYNLISTNQKLGEYSRCLLFVWLISFSSSLSLSFSSWTILTLGHLYPGLPELRTTEMRLWI